MLSVVLCIAGGVVWCGDRSQPKIKQLAKAVQRGPATRACRPGTRTCCYLLMLLLGGRNAMSESAGGRGVNLALFLSVFGLCCIKKTRQKKEVRTKKKCDVEKHQKLSTSAAKNILSARNAPTPQRIELKPRRLCSDGLPVSTSFAFCGKVR